MTVEDDVVDALACYRITRLVVDDRVPFGPLREWIRTKAFDAQAKRDVGKGETSQADPYLVELIECPFCVSVWVGAGVVLFARRVPGWRTLSRILAASAVASVLSKYVSDD